MKEDFPTLGKPQRISVLEIENMMKVKIDIMKYLPRVRIDAWKSTQVLTDLLEIVK